MGKVAGSAGRGNGGRPADSRRNAAAGGASTAPDTQAINEANLQGRFEALDAGIKQQALRSDYGSYPLMPARARDEYRQYEAALQRGVQQGLVTRAEARTAARMPVIGGFRGIQAEANGRFIFRSNLGEEYTFTGNYRLSAQSARARAAAAGANSLTLVRQGR